MLDSVRKFTLRILVWSGKRLRTDLVYLAKGGFWLTLRLVLGMVFSFTSAVVFGRLIEKTTYGDYKYLLSVSGIISSLMLTGLGSAVTQAIARGHDGTLIKAFWLNLKWSGFAFIASLAMAGYYVWIGNIPFAIAFVIIAVTTPLFRGLQLSLAYFNGKRQFRTSTVLGLFSDTFTFISMIVTVMLTRNLISLIAVFFISTLLGSLAMYLYTLRRITDPQDIEYDVFRFSKHLSLTGIFGNIAGQADKLLIYHFLGPIDLAVYTFALAVPKQVRTALSSLVTLAMPKYATMSFAQARHSVKKKFLLSLLFTVPVLLAYQVAAPYIYKVFFPAYLESVPYSRAYALIFLLFGNFSYVAFEAKKHIKATYLLNILPSFLQIGLMLLLIRPFGINGIIIALLASKGISFLFSLFILKTAKDEVAETPLNRSAS